MNFRAAFLPLALAVLPGPPLQAVELTGRFSMLAASARAEPGELGYVSGSADTLSADQQTLRLMLDESGENSEWSLHLRNRRLHSSAYPQRGAQPSDLFRYHTGAGNWLAPSTPDDYTRVGYEIDRAVYRRRFEALTVGLGRQAVDWGSGRLWQPLNLFGAFAPTDLDTDYKPGIDALSLETYPGPFSSLQALYAWAPHDAPELENSGALYYRRALGEASELTAAAGRISGSKALGASFESAWGGMGWRIEGLLYRVPEEEQSELFWIAGIEHQFENGSLLILEWYENSRGGATQAELATLGDDPLLAGGLQQHLSRRVLGLGLSKDLTPLLNAGYTLLASTLRDESGQRHGSLLHQLNLVYSVSNESDLLISLLSATGRGLAPGDVPRSEFGHIPDSLSVRLRFYF